MTRLEPEEPPPAAQVRVGGAEQPREEGGAGGHAPPWGQDDPLDRGVFGRPLYDQCQS